MVMARKYKQEEETYRYLFVANNSKKTVSVFCVQGLLTLWAMGNIMEQHEVSL
jgi:hypothetical protein